MSTFDWQNVPDGLRRAVLTSAGAADVDEMAEMGLAEPDQAFVGRFRAAILEWLANDKEQRHRVVRRLIELRVIPHREVAIAEEAACLETAPDGRMFRFVLLEAVEAAGRKELLPVPADEGITERSDGSVRYKSFWDISMESLEPTFRPYDHQKRAWRALDETPPDQGGLLVLPTGAGKTVTAVRWILENVLNEDSGGPVLWLAHRAELLHQAAKTFAAHAPIARRTESLKIRCISSVHGSSASTLLRPADVYCATDASLGRQSQRVKEFFKRNPDTFVVIDEAHHAAAKRYQELIEASRKQPRTRLLGLTATPTRTVERELGRLEVAFPQQILFQVEQAELIDQGILSRPVCEAVETGITVEHEFEAGELAHLRRFGDLAAKSLERIAGHLKRNAAIVNRYMEFREDYGPTLVFACSVAHCHTLSRELNELGIRANYVTYRREDGRSNEKILSEFRDGRLDVLLTVTKLTEGVDLPTAQTVFLTRPTGSRILLSQMIGRGMRGTDAGGTDEVRIVSFEDHWTRFPNWLDPIEFIGGEYVVDPTAEVVQREKISVPWALFLEIARMVRQEGSNEVSSTHFPVGWYDVATLDSLSGGQRFVVVYSDQIEGYERLVDAAVSAHPRRVSLTGWFEISTTPASDQALTALQAFIAETGQAPVFQRFTDLDATPHRLAARIRHLDRSQIRKAISAEYAGNPSLVAFYPTESAYGRTVLEVMAHLEYPAGFDERTVRDLSEDLPPLPKGDWDLKTLAKKVHGAMKLKKPLPKIEWSRQRARYHWGTYRAHPTPLILINPILKTTAIDQHTIEFLLFHELLHHEMPNEGHGPRFREREQQFPGWMDAEADLDTLQERGELSTTRPRVS